MITRSVTSRTLYTLRVITAEVLKFLFEWECWLGRGRHSVFKPLPLLHFETSQKSPEEGGSNVIDIKFVTNCLVVSVLFLNFAVGIDL